MNNNVTEAEFITGFDSKEYQLLAKIGQGGFARIYKAIQVSTQQIVAVKLLIINPEYERQKQVDYRRRISKEIFLCSLLQHPNIVRVLGQGECTSGLVYAVFEYIEGQTLKEKLARSGALRPLEAAGIMAQVLDALAHAHARGVIHKDLKPENIMLTHMGTRTHVKLLDFGVSDTVSKTEEMLSGVGVLSQENHCTPSYSSPEQLRGEKATVKTDLYAWGLVFVECLTGKPLISGQNLTAIVHKQLSDTATVLPPAIADHSVADLLQRVLKKDATERTASAAEIYKQLERIDFSNLAEESCTNRHSGKDIAVTTQDYDYECDYEISKTEEQQYICGLSERKQITVLCVKIGIRSPGVEFLDLDMLDEIYRARIASCMDIARRYGAFHAGTLGDTILFFYGYPYASKDDARLSAVTALEIVNLFVTGKQGGQKDDIVVTAHIGIYTGIMTAIGNRVPDGMTTNMAMELARTAPANQILCTKETEHLLSKYMDLELSCRRIEGINTQSLRLYTIKRELSINEFSFFETKAAAGGAIGRRHEIDFLTQLIGRKEDTTVHDSLPMFCHISGEDGTGKSRLIHEVRKKSPYITCHAARCLPEYQENVLYPVFEILDSIYSINGLARKTAVNLLRDIIRSSPELNEETCLPVLCLWLNLPLPDGLNYTQYSGQEQIEILFAALAVLLTGINNKKNRSGMLYVFEDIDWIDTLSLEFIRYLINHAAFVGQEHVLLSTARHSAPKKISDLPGYREIRLAGLNRKKTNKFIERLFDNQKVDPELVDAVYKRSDGVPLYIQELVDLMKRRKLVHRFNGIVTFNKVNSFNEMPSRLREIMQKRLDELVIAKEIVQLAAIIGREVNRELLLDLSKQDEIRFNEQIKELIATGIFTIKHELGRVNYLFKHHLMRDVAYDSLTDSDKREMHSRVAMVLQNTLGPSTNKALSNLHYQAARHNNYFFKEQCANERNDSVRPLINRFAIGDAEVDAWFDRLEQIQKHENTLKEIYASGDKCADASF